MLDDKAAAELIRQSLLVLEKLIRREMEKEAAAQAAGKGLLFAHLVNR